MLNLSAERKFSILISLHLLNTMEAKMNNKYLINAYFLNY